MGMAGMTVEEFKRLPAYRNALWLRELQHEGLHPPGRSRDQRQLR